jgi:trk system potassium uptake protein TrkH
LYTGPRLDWNECIMTATSAVCVTGMLSMDVGTYFTLQGQAYVLLLIQLGGLGMITFTSLIIVALGRRLSLRAEVLAGPTDVTPVVSPRKLVRDVVIFTLMFEVAGALLLYLLWAPRMGMQQALWPAVFHSVSAFCNAGFSTFSNSLVELNRSPLSLAVIGLLIIAGGIGFLTLEELLLRWRAYRMRSIFRISLHSRLVLATTGVLLVGGWGLYGLFEWNSALAPLSGPHKVTNALFMSITARTTGYHSVDYATLSESGAFATILLMSIGGSPGSAAGGMKTTTIALIGLLAWSRMRGRTVTSLWGRSVPEETNQRAIGLFVVAFAVMTCGIFMLTVTEGPSGDQRFLHHMFEAVSAFNTVGLSMDTTGDLSPLGRWVTVVLMFLGRVGPLTFAAALATRRRDRTGFRYASEDVVVG